MDQCGTCGWWVLTPQKNTTQTKSRQQHREEELWTRRYGRCRRIPYFSDAMTSRWDEASATYHEQWRADSMMDVAFVVDGDDVDYSLIVHETFGCRLYTTREEAELETP